MRAGLSFHGGKAAGAGVVAHVVPRLRVSGAVPPLSLSLTIYLHMCVRARVCVFIENRKCKLLS